MLKCSNVQISKCLDVKRFQCSNVPMFQCSNVPMFQYSNAQMLKCSNFLMLKCSNVRMFKFSNDPVFQCSDVQMFKCSNVEAAAGVGPTPASSAPPSTSTSTSTSTSSKVPLRCAAGSTGHSLIALKAAHWPIYFLRDSFNLHFSCRRIIDQHVYVRREVEMPHYCVVLLPVFLLQVSKLLGELGRLLPLLLLPQPLPLNVILQLGYSLIGPLSAILSSNLVFAATPDIPQLVLLLLRESTRAQKVHVYVRREVEMPHYCVVLLPA